MTIETDCDNYGCYWWNSACHDQVPSCEAINNQPDCSEYSCYWYDGACHSEAPPPPPEEYEAPCAVPPFLSETVPPNVLIIMDNSGSMNWLAYVDQNSDNPSYYDYGSYTPTLRYYGYADPDSYYEYNSSNNRFEVTYSWSGTADPAHKRFSGNFLNWVMSRRIDIERQVLIGGKCLDRSVEGRKTLVWEDPAQSRELWKYWWCDDGCRWRFRNDDDYTFDAYKYSSCSHGSWNYMWSTRKRVIGPETVEGFVQETFDRVRYGMEHFNDSNGGYIAVWIGSPESNLISDVENKGCNTWTPLAESFYEATRYFQATSSYYNSVNYGSHDPINNWCQTNYVILITDGESTQDRDIPSWLRDYDNDGDDPIPAGAHSGYPWSSNGSDYLDDVALWAHTTDLRSDFEGEQNIVLYTVYAFGQSEDAIGILKRAAINGSFTDKNDNDIPDLTEEYDADSDGEPDGYYQAANGWQLKNALTSIFINIMRQTSAAAAVSVVSTSDKGEGNVFQAYFSPKRTLVGTDLSWVGEFHALWIDQLGNLREDTDQNQHLNLDTDRILHIYFDPSQNSTVVQRWEDTDGDCEEDALDDEVGVNDISSVWRAGVELWEEKAKDRKIKVVVPETSGDGYELIDFKKGPAHTPRIMPHLSFATTTEQAESLINYIRGVDYADKLTWRDRTAGGKVWKLSDIVNSTPTYVGPPADRYDLIYDDDSYRIFFQQYADRRGVVYVGANDGMLHMFNAGRYYETGEVLDRGYLDNMGKDLGEEVEAIIPFDLLPHLQWLSNPEYCHVYYVDLKPKAFDARIFNDDSKHPNGWGTVLVCGMRFGGSEYVIPNYNTYRSAYLALDITDPDDIEFMWEANDEDLAFTTCYPAAAKVGDKWFLLAGSGPTSFGGTSSQQSVLYIANVADIDENRKFYGSSSAHFADAMPVDVDMDGNVDLIYIGESYWTGGSWYGRIYKVLTYESDDLDDWTMATFMDVPGPISTGGGATMDDQGNLWLYFGSGRYFSDIDEGDMSDQCFFGAKDPDWDAASSVVYSNLIDITDATIQQTDTGTYVYGYHSEPISYDSLMVEIKGAPGWKMTLTDGERVINRPLIIGGVVFFTTFIPNDDLCSFGGISNLYGIDYRTGVPGETSILGMDSDGWLYEFVELGQGVPSAPAAHIGITDEAMIVVQLSTGAIAQKGASVNSPKSKGLFWRGK